MLKVEGDSHATGAGNVQDCRNGFDTGIELRDNSTREAKHAHAAHAAPMRRDKDFHVVVRANIAADKGDARARVDGDTRELHQTNRQWRRPP